MRLRDMDVERIQHLLFTPKDVLVAEGMAEGRAEGRMEGMRELLLGMIERRFGTVPDAARARLEEIVEETELQSLGERLFMGDDLEALGLA